MSGFPPGFAIIYDGQRYMPVGLVDHIGKDGVPMKLVEWATHCAACDAPLTVRSPLVTAYFARRCAACSRPGMPVTDDERANLKRRLERAE